MKSICLIVAISFITTIYSQDRQRYQTSSPTFVQDKMYQQNASLYEMQQQLNTMKSEDWDTSFPIIQESYNSKNYANCINLSFKLMDRTGFSNAYLYFLIGDSYKHLSYYKSAKKYLKIAKRKGNSQASSELINLKESYKNTKIFWANK